MITAFNASKYIALCIKSALEQSYENIELIICDDCSTDDTWEIVNQFTDERIQSFRNNRNVGVSVSRNNCLRIASGDYIAVLDADDIWRVDKIEKQVRFLEANSAVGIVGANAEEIDETGQRTGGRSFPKNHLAIMDKRLWACPFLHSSILVRREAMLPYSSKVKQAEDWELENRILTKWKGANLQEELVKYRIHSENLTNSKTDEQRTEALAVVSSFSEIHALSRPEFEVYAKLFNYKVGEIDQGLLGLVVVLKLARHYGFQRASRRRLLWILGVVWKRMGF